MNTQMLLKMCKKAIFPFLCLCKDNLAWQKLGYIVNL